MDVGLFDEVNRFAVATPWLHAAVTGYAAFGVVLFAAIMLAGWWYARRTSEADRVAAAVLAPVATLLAVAVNQPFVSAFHEARPYTSHPDILVLATRSTDFSFPSDHSVMAGAAAAALWFVSRRLGLVTAVAALAMGFSRIYIAAHYPHDVLVGLLLGAVVAVLVVLLARPFTTRLVTATGRTALRPLVTAEPPTPPGPVVAAAGRERTPPEDTGR
ncbi:MULTISPECIES: phosphatase PAP2 family protein [Micromonospora]|uniref:Phosphatase PAP2 family protein n=1 Tax=Micromonospora sicca TaxID=2202420 RepID=A0A317DGE3_9ACTN|nr:MULTISPECIES: phosphatase PAP2 family protein [unclassified Micromonospora]MBM0228764.1 phosphatase PAP2 family protein [Micromonospora sp. ATA51]MDZ5443000.1 phosphatase PAP2 family protein [Micromonospora sp. 4G57]MDZ5488289.1 phosphatase PAP2 family protein [Micromonospora sp. 4G53]PWR13839.1 UDP-diphosphatase [Micromonospora sp. 4G51]